MLLRFPLKRLHEFSDVGFHHELFRFPALNLILRLLNRRQMTPFRMGTNPVGVIRDFSQDVNHVPLNEDREHSGVFQLDRQNHSLIQNRLCPF